MWARCDVGTMTRQPRARGHRLSRSRLVGARTLVAGHLLALPFAMVPYSAAADFRLCNNTSSRVGISVGYKENEGWTTEGWWNLSARSCETLLRGVLVARFYYIYAIDYDHGGEWSGQAFMCTREKEFTIKGTADCLARGFDRTGFFEVDTGEQPSWTVQLTEPAELAPKTTLPSRVPPIQTPAGTGRSETTPAPSAPKSKN